MSDASLPPGAIPVDQFQADDSAAAPGIQPAKAVSPGLPPGAIPVDQFESQDQSDEKYGTGGQQAIAGIEGMAKGVAGPLATYAEKHILGVPQEDIAGRERANPWTAGIGEGAGLVGSTLTGVGVGSALAHVGQAAEAVAGLGKVSEAAELMNAAKAAVKAGAPEAASLMQQAEAVGQTVSKANKIGSAVVKGAAEMAALQSSDEAAKYVVTDVDPGTAAETAIGNIGLAAALGGAGGGFMKGAVSPLWASTVGPKVEGALSGLMEHFGGTELQAKEAAMGRTSQQLEQDSGIALKPEIKAVIDNVPGAKNAASGLNQSDTYFAGKSFQKTMNETESQVGDNIISQLGRNPEDVKSMAKLNDYDAAQEAKKTLIGELREQAKPIEDKFNSFVEEHGSSPLTGNVKNSIQDQIAQTALDSGWAKASGGGSQKFAETVMSDLSKQENINDLKLFITNLRQDNPFTSPNYRAAQKISGIVQRGLETAVGDSVVSKTLEGGSIDAAKATAAGKVAEYNQARQDYGAYMRKLEGLNEHLHVGRYSGPGSFINNLEKKFNSKGEQMLNRLTSVKNVDVLNQLANFPKTLEHVKNYHIDDILRDAALNPGLEKDFNVQKMVKALRNLPPQVQELIANPEQHRVIDASSSILKNLEDATKNFSNTARTGPKQGHNIATPMAMIMGLMHGTTGGVSALLGALGAGEVKDGVKLAALRWAGSDKPVSAAGFSAMAKFANATIKGENTVNKAVANVFKPGANVLIDSQMPSAKDLVKLDKLISDNQDNPEAELHSQDSQLGHYMPNHQVAATQATQQMQQYLQSLKPKPHQAGPLDRPIEPTAQEKLRYERALTIAQQPATVMQHIKDGTLQPSDIQDLHNMYPGLYKKYAEKLSNQMQSHTADEEPIPYKTRMGISLFLGQPIDSSMSPMSIQAAQPKPKPMPPQAPGGKPKSTKSLGKSTKEYQTPLQGAESDRANRD